jgi:hypothetical protein
MEKFWLWRRKDKGGVSGTGLVAEGVQFTDGTTVLRWRTPTPGTVLYAKFGDMIAIHGHGDQTVAILERDLFETKTGMILLNCDTGFSCCQDNQWEGCLTNFKTGQPTPGFEPFTGSKEQIEKAMRWKRKRKAVKKL